MKSTHTEEPINKRADEQQLGLEREQAQMGGKQSATSCVNNLDQAARGPDPPRYTQPPGAAVNRRQRRRLNEQRDASCTCSAADQTNGSLIGQAGSAMERAAAAMASGPAEQRPASPKQQLPKGGPLLAECCKCPDCKCPGCANNRGTAAGCETSCPSASKRQLGVAGKQAAGPPPPLPIRVLVEPRNDDSVRCDCRNCQFFSGWCCMPCALVIIIVVVVLWISTRMTASAGNNNSQATTAPPTTTTTTTTASTPATTAHQEHNSTGSPLASLVNATTAALFNLTARAGASNATTSVRPRVLRTQLNDTFL